MNILLSDIEFHCFLYRKKEIYVRNLVNCVLENDNEVTLAAEK